MTRGLLGARAEGKGIGHIWHVVLQVLMLKGKVLEAKKRVIASSFFANLLSVLESTNVQSNEQSANGYDDDATAPEELNAPQGAF